MKINQNFGINFTIVKTILKFQNLQILAFFINFIKRNNEILEIGCGNGRDAFLFQKKKKS